MTEEQTEEQWEALLAAEHDARQRLDKLYRSPAPAKTALKAAAQEWWGTVGEVLAHYSIALYAEMPPKASPKNVLAVISAVAAELSQGTAREAIKDAMSPGAPVAPYTKQADIAAAVAYIEAAKAGEINDASYTSTVKLHYGVTEKTVRAWAKNATAHLRFFPHVRTREPDAIAWVMKESGVRYKASNGRDTGEIS